MNFGSDCGTDDFYRLSAPCEISEGECAPHKAKHMRNSAWAGFRQGTCTLKGGKHTDLHRVEMAHSGTFSGVGGETVLTIIRNHAGWGQKDIRGPPTRWSESRLP